MGAKNATPAAPLDATKTYVAKELGHGSPVISCRYDLSGRFVFFGAQDFRVWRWEPTTGQKLPLNGHECWHRGLTFAPDRKTLVVGGYDGRVSWWPVAADKFDKPARIIDAHKGWVRAVAVNPDGTLLATVGNDLLVKLWRMSDGSAVCTMTGHQSHIYNVAFHPDGRQLVTTDLKCNVFHWELMRGTLARQLSAEALYKYDQGFQADIGGAQGMTFSRDGSQLAISGITNVSNAFACVGNPSVVVLDWKTGKLKVQHLAKEAFQGVAWGVALHPSGLLIIAAGGPGGGMLYFFKPGEKNEFHKVKMPDTCRDLDLSPDGLHLATAHFDGRVRISRMTAKA